MRVPGALVPLLLLLTLPGPASAAPPGDTFDRAVALLSADGEPGAAPPAAPAEEKKEAPPKPVSSPAALALVAEAAAAQGTAAFVGEKAVRRFRAVFDPVKVHSEKGNEGSTTSEEAFALPPAGKSESLLRSSWIHDGRRVTLGHDGRSGWIRVEGEEARRFTDPEGKDAQDVEDLDHRRRMLRLALRVFFLGNLAEGPAVTLLPDGEVVIPHGNGAEATTKKVRILSRAASPADGEPPMLICLDGESLLPVAVILVPAEANRVSTLLTFDYDPEEWREKGAIPEGVKVPAWCELFDVPPPGAGEPEVRIQAGVARLEIDPARVPDSLFAFPR